MNPLWVRSTWARSYKTAQTTWHFAHEGTDDGALANIPIACDLGLIANEYFEAQRDAGKPDEYPTPVCLACLAARTRYWAEQEGAR